MSSVVFPKQLGPVLEPLERGLSRQHRPVPVERLPARALGQLIPSPRNRGEGRLPSGFTINESVGETTGIRKLLRGRVGRRRVSVTQGLPARGTACCFSVLAVGATTAAQVWKTNVFPTPTGLEHPHSRFT